MRRLAHHDGDEHTANDAVSAWMHLRELECLQKGAKDANPEILPIGKRTELLPDWRK